MRPAFILCVWSQGGDGASCDLGVCGATSTSANLLLSGALHHDTHSDARVDAAHVISIPEVGPTAAGPHPTSGSHIECAAAWIQHTAQGSTEQASSSSSSSAEGAVRVDMTAALTRDSGAVVDPCAVTPAADAPSEASLGTMARASAVSHVSSVVTVEGQLLVEGADDFELPGVGRVAVVLGPDRRQCGLGVVVADS